MFDLISIGDPAVISYPPHPRIDKTAQAKPDDKNKNKKQYIQ